jgi:hypothetical protein
MNAPEMIPLEVKVTHPTAAALSRGAASALALVAEFEVTDDPTFEIAADELQAIKAKASALDEQRKSITAPMDAAKKAVMDLFRAPIEALQTAEGILKGKMLAYQQDQQRKANEARLEAERVARAERERLEREAAELAAQGRTGEAAIKEQVAQMVVAAPIMAPEAPAAKGISTRETVEFEVTDLHALIKHVAVRPELVGLLMPDSTKLRAYVRGLGMQCNLDGVRVFVKQSLAARKG